MPTRAPKICRDCNQVEIRNGYCDRHQKDNRAARYEQTRQQARRDSGLDALYHSKAWKLQTRPNVLRRDPLCKIGVLCEGRAPSTDVHHKIRATDYLALHNGDQWCFFDEENLVGICHRCHAHITSLEARGLWNPR